MTDLNDLHDVLQRREAVVAEVDPSVTDVLIRAYRWQRTQRIARAVVMVVVLGAALAAIGWAVTG